MTDAQVLRIQMITHPSLRHNLESYLGVDEAGAGLAQVPLVGDEAGAPEAARTAQLVHPFRPLRVQPAVWFLVFRLKYAYDFLEEIILDRMIKIVQDIGKLTVKHFIGSSIIKKCSQITKFLAIIRIEIFFFFL